MKIDKGIPIPEECARFGKQKYPWDEMEIGDSFFVEKKQRTMYERSRNLKCVRQGGKKFTCRTSKENGKIGCRCWRTK